MFTLTAKNLWAHKRRMTGTVLAVVLGVAFLSGTLLLSDTRAPETMSVCVLLLHIEAGPVTELERL